VKHERKINGPWLAALGGVIAFAIATVVYLRSGEFTYVLEHCQTGNNCTFFQMLPFVYWFIFAGILTYLILVVPFHKPEEG